MLLSLLLPSQGQRSVEARTIPREMAREARTRWHTLGLLEGRKGLTACRVPNGPCHLFWQDTYYQPRALEKHADSILALVSQLCTCDSVILTRPTQLLPSSLGVGGALSSVQKNICVPKAQIVGLPSWGPPLCTISFLWSSLSPEDNTCTPGISHRSLGLQSPVTCPPWQLTSLAASAAVLSGRVPMVMFSYLWETKPRTLLSGANCEGLINLSRQRGWCFQCDETVSASVTL